MSHIKTVFSAFVLLFHAASVLLENNNNSRTPRTDKPKKHQSNKQHFVQIRVCSFIRCHLPSSFMLCDVHTHSQYLFLGFCISSSGLLLSIHTPDHLSLFFYISSLLMFNFSDVLKYNGGCCVVYIVCQREGRVLLVSAML